jgi:hypothetical protein
MRIKILNQSIVIRIVFVTTAVAVVAVVAVVVAAFSINATIDNITGSLAALEMKSTNLVRLLGC